MKNIVVQGSSFNIVPPSGTSQVGLEVQSVANNDLEPKIILKKDTAKKQHKTFYLDINNIKLYDRVLRQRVSTHHVENDMNTHSMVFTPVTNDQHGLSPEHKLTQQNFYQGRNRYPLQSKHDSMMRQSFADQLSPLILCEEKEVGGQESLMGDAPQAEIDPQMKVVFNNISLHLIRTMEVEKSKDTLKAEKEIEKKKVILSRDHTSKQSLEVLEDNLKKNGIISKEIILKQAIGQWSQSSESKTHLNQGSRKQQISPRPNFQFQKLNASLSPLISPKQLALSPSESLNTSPFTAMRCKFNEPEKQFKAIKMIEMPPKKPDKTTEKQTLSMSKNSITKKVSQETKEIEQRELRISKSVDTSTEDFQQKVKVKKRMTQNQHSTINSIESIDSVRNSKLRTSYFQTVEPIMPYIMHGSHDQSINRLSTPSERDHPHQLLTQNKFKTRFPTKNVSPKNVENSPIRMKAITMEEQILQEKAQILNRSVVFRGLKPKGLSDDTHSVFKSTGFKNKDIQFPEILTTQVKQIFKAPKKKKQKESESLLGIYGLIDRQTSNIKLHSIEPQIGEPMSPMNTKVIVIKKEKQYLHQSSSKNLNTFENSHEITNNQTLVVPSPYLRLRSLIDDGSIKKSKKRYNLNQAQLTESQIQNTTETLDYSEAQLPHIKPKLGKLIKMSYQVNKPAPQPELQPQVNQMIQPPERTRNQRRSNTQLGHNFRDLATILPVINRQLAEDKLESQQNLVIGGTQAHITYNPRKTNRTLRNSQMYTRKNLSIRYNLKDPATHDYLKDINWQQKPSFSRIDPYERARRTRQYTDMLKSTLKGSGTLNIQVSQELVDKPKLPETLAPSQQNPRQCDAITSTKHFVEHMIPLPDADPAMITMEHNSEMSKIMYNIPTDQDVTEMIDNGNHQFSSKLSK